MGRLRTVGTSNMAEQQGRASEANPIPLPAVTEEAHSSWKEVTQ